MFWFMFLGLIILSLKNVYSIGDTGVYAFSLGICLKVNITAQLVLSANILITMLQDLPKL